MKYAAKKLAALLATMLAVSFVTFAAFQVVAGDPATDRLGTEATPERVEQLRHEMGLDRPFLVQYGSWLAGFVRGDLGDSYSGGPVADLLAARTPVTLALSLMAFVLTAGTALPLGLLSVRRGGRVGGAVRTAVNQLLTALPPFFTGILLTWLFSILLHWFRHGAFPGFAADPAGSLWYLLFPAAAIAIPGQLRPSGCCAARFLRRWTGTMCARPSPGATTARAFCTATCCATPPPRR